MTESKFKNPVSYSDLSVFLQCTVVLAFYKSDSFCDKTPVGYNIFYMLL